jgi:basic amino acid/polyamine antiporter, APA family
MDSSSGATGVSRDEPSTKPGLVRAIGRFDLTAAVVNGVIGSAIFGMPGLIAGLVGPLSPLAWVLAGLGMLTMILCFAEVGSRFKESGGPYLYAREAFGSFVGFQAGWLTFWIRVFTFAANVNLFTNYLAQVLPAAGSGGGRLSVLTLLVALLTWINLVGVRQATWTVNAFTIAKLLPLLLLILLGLGHVSRDTMASQTVASPDWTQAILLLVFAYGGFEAPLIPASEARDPRRDTAFALLAGTAVVATIYVLVQLAVVGLVPGVAGEQAPVAAAYQVLAGPPGVAFASLAAMVSVYGWAMGTVLQSPRVLFSMAERRELPELFGRVHARFHTPHIAILFFSLIGWGLAVSGTFVSNATLSVVVRLVTYGLTCASLPVFRKRLAEPPGFRLPAAPVIVALGLAFGLWLLYDRGHRALSGSQGDLVQMETLAGLIAVGAALFFAARREAVR